MALPPQPPVSYERNSEASAPRAVLRINGANVYALEHFDISLNAHGATNEASVFLPIKGNPDFSAAFDKSYSGTAATGEIFVGWPNNPQASPSIAGLQRVYYGLIAQYDPNFAGNSVAFHLRSLASPLVIEKIQQLATNLTTVDFIQSVCSQFGLQFVHKLGNAPLTVQEVLGQMFVGGYNFSAAIHGMRIWDLIIQCAQFDNVDAWEDQGVVYYVAPTLLSRTTWNLKYGGSDFAVDDGFRGTHSLQFSKQIQVEVRSFQPRVSQSTAVRFVTQDDGSISVTSVSKTTTASPQWGTPTVVSQTITPKGTVINNRTVSGGNFSTTTSLGTESSKERYIYYLRNASPSACNAFAISRWRQISQQEYVAQMRIPLTKRRGILPLTALLSVSDCEYSKFNTTYYPRTIKFTGGSHQAFEYNIDAVNHELPQGAV